MERFAAQAKKGGFPHWLGPINIKRWRRYVRDREAGGELHHFAQRARYLLEEVYSTETSPVSVHRAGKAVRNPLHRAGFGGDIAGDNRRFARRDG